MICIYRNFILYLKEIQLIAPEQPVPNTANDSSLTTKPNPQSVHHTNQQTCKNFK